MEKKWIIPNEGETGRIEVADTHEILALDKDTLSAVTHPKYEEQPAYVKGKVILCKIFFVSFY